MNKEHNCGIDLLRLVLMFMVCILHVLGHGGVLANSPVGSIKYSFFWFMEIFSYCAVDAFALISGYMAPNRPCKYEKIVNIWFKVFFYSFFVTIFLVFIDRADNNLGNVDIIKNIFPIVHEKYWYMTAYFLLFLSTPILNSFLFNISEEKAKKVFAFFIIFFSCTSLIGDPFKFLDGYSAFWLIILYCIGALGNKIDVFSKIKTSILIFVWGLLIIGTWYSYVYVGTLNLVNYVSPTILFSALIMVVLFKRLKFKNNFIIKLASLSLGVYLLQLNQIIWNNAIADRFIFIAYEKTYLGVFYVLLIALVMWVSGLVVEFIRSKIADYLKIDLLCKKIVSVIDFILKKVSYCLK